MSVIPLPTAAAVPVVNPPRRKLPRAIVQLAKFKSVREHQAILQEDQKYALAGRIASARHTAVAWLKYADELERGARA